MAMSKKGLQQVFWAAARAGREAGDAHVPQPIVVGNARSLFSNEIDRNGPLWRSDAGVCGFAWVKLLGGNSQAARYAVKRGIARSRPGGPEIWISDHGQSHEKKMAHAAAYARVLKQAGIEAYADGRMD